MAQTITDKHSRSYGLDLNLGTARRIQKATGLNLLADTIFMPMDPGANQDGAGGGMAVALPLLEADPVKLAEVLWSAVEPECGPRSISQEMFDQGWDGPTLKTAYAALVEAVADFFPDRAERIRNLAATLAEARGKNGEAQEAMVAAGRNLLAGIDVEATVAKMLAENEAKLGRHDAGGSKTPGNMSSSSPAAWASPATASGS